MRRDGLTRAELEAVAYLCAATDALHELPGAGPDSRPGFACGMDREAIAVRLERLGVAWLGLAAELRRGERFRVWGCAAGG